MKYIYVSDVDRALLGGARHFRLSCYAKSAATIYMRQPRTCHGLALFLFDVSGVRHVTSRHVRYIHIT